MGRVLFSIVVIITEILLHASQVRSDLHILKVADTCAIGFYSQVRTTQIVKIDLQGAPSFYVLSEQDPFTSYDGKHVTKNRHQEAIKDISNEN